MKQLVLLAVSAVAFVPLAPTRLTSVLREAVDPEPEMIDPAWRQIALSSDLSSKEMDDEKTTAELFMLGQDDALAKAIAEEDAEAARAQEAAAKAEAAAKLLADKARADTKAAAEAAEALKAEKAFKFESTWPRTAGVLRFLRLRS